MQAQIRRQRLRYAGRTILLLTGLFVVMAGAGYILFGIAGVAVAAMGSALLAFGAGRIPVRYVMRLQGARALLPAEAPELHNILGQLAQRAGLRSVPVLYYMPSRLVNAFAAGNEHQSAVAVTYGLLMQMNLREISGVLAHEISHLKHHDLRIHSLTRIVHRITRSFSFAGKVLVLLNLSLWLAADSTEVPWGAIAVLLAAPLLSGLFMLAVSRTREFDADLEAVHLTGDPNGLADALHKLRMLGANPFIQRLPKVLQTHPDLSERIRRLRELAPRYVPEIDVPHLSWALYQYPFLGKSRFL